MEFENRYTSPLGGRRACLCKDGTYRIECCKGFVRNQGIGSLVTNSTSNITNEDTQEILINNSNAVNFTCSDVDSNLSISDTGAITASAGVGTLLSFSPLSFSAVNSTTTREVELSIEAAQGYANEGIIHSCTVSASQNAPTLICDNLLISGFAISDAGVITSPTVTLNSSSVSFSSSPSSYSVVTSDTVQTLTLTVTVPSNYHNTGGTITCTTTATQLRDTFNCSSTTISGFAVSQTGVVTSASSSVGTISSISPTSFAIVNTNTTRTLTLNITAPSTYLNSGNSVACTTTATQVLTPTFTCSNVTLSNFAVTQGGVITAPTANVGTISSITYTSSNSNNNYSIVNTNTTRSASVIITIPSGYFNTGSTVTCTTTSSQASTPTFSCIDVSFSGFAISTLGIITLPSLNTGSIASSSPSSYNLVNTGTTQTLNVGVTVPANYYNTGSSVACTTTATQAAADTFACSDVTISGFAVNPQTGVVTAPTINVGTLVSVSPAAGYSYSTVTTNTTRTATLTITAPANYYNTGANISCSTTTVQTLPTLYTADMNLTNYNPLVFSAASDYVFNANIYQYGRTVTSFFDDRNGNTTWDKTTEPAYNRFFSIKNQLPSESDYTGLDYITAIAPYGGNLTKTTSTLSTVVGQATIVVKSGWANATSTLTANIGNVTRPALPGDIHKIWTFTADYTGYTTYRISTTINGSTSVTQDLVLKGCTSLYSVNTPIIVSGRSDGPTFTDSGATSTSWGCGQSTELTVYYSPNSSSEADAYAADNQAYGFSSNTLYRVKSILAYCNFSSSGVDAGIVGATVYNILLTPLCQGSNEFTRQSESVTSFPNGSYSTTGESGAISSGIVTSMS